MRKINVERNLLLVILNVENIKLLYKWIIKSQLVCGNKWCFNYKQFALCASFDGCGGGGGGGDDDWGGAQWGTLIQFSCNEVGLLPIDVDVSHWQPN